MHTQPKSNLRYIWRKIIVSSCWMVVLAVDSCPCQWPTMLPRLAPSLVGWARLPIFGRKPWEFFHHLQFIINFHLCSSSDEVQIFQYMIKTHTETKSVEARDHFIGIYSSLYGQISSWKAYLCEQSSPHHSLLRVPSSKAKSKYPRSSLLTNHDSPLVRSSTTVRRLYVTWLPRQMCLRCDYFSTAVRESRVE